MEPHIIAEFDESIPANVTLAPTGRVGRDFIPLSAHDDQTGAEADLIVNKPLLVEDGEPMPFPEEPNPVAGRAPLLFDPNSYATLEPGNNVVDVNMRDERIPMSRRTRLPEGISEAQFQAIAAKYKGSDGKYVAMTCYGAVPVPDDLIKAVPHHFEQEPIIEEKHQFVAKPSRHERKVEKDFVQHHHHFVEVVKSGVVDKLVPAGGEKKVEIPNYNYVGVVADNIVEIPQGTKYVEVPLDVFMKKPPRIVPVAKPLVIQRNIECTKHIVQDKIIEVPKVIKKQVPKHIVKEVPYVVPKYVDTVIEVPYKPGMEMPQQRGSRLLPSQIPATPPGFEVAAVTTNYLSFDGRPLLLKNDGRTLIFEDGRPMLDAAGIPYVLSDDKMGYVDSQGNVIPAIRNAAPAVTPGTPVYTQPKQAEFSGFMPATSVTPGTFIAPGSGAQMSASPGMASTFGSVAAAEAAALQGVEFIPGYLNGEPGFMGPDGQFYPADKEIELTVIPHEPREIELPYDAEIDISVVAIDPDTGMPMELSPEQQAALDAQATQLRPDIKTPSQQGGMTSASARTPSASSRTASASNRTPGPSGAVQITESTVFFPPAQLKGATPQTHLTPSNVVNRVANNTYNVQSPQQLINQGFYVPAHSSPAAAGSKSPSSISRRTPSRATPSNTSAQGASPSPRGSEARGTGLSGLAVSPTAVDNAPTNVLPDAVYATSLEPIIEIDEPGLKGVKFNPSSSSVQVVTNKGIKNLDTLHWTCGDPVRQLRGPFSHVPVPLDSEGKPDTDELDHVQEEYLKRYNPTFNIEGVTRLDDMVPPPVDSGSGSEFFLGAMPTPQSTAVKSDVARDFVTVRASGQARGSDARSTDARAAQIAQDVHDAVAHRAHSVAEEGQQALAETLAKLQEQNP